ncbi:MAG: preprotein translocase subunit YajC [Epsilonproteobacteria bacterium]|nr:preprotein translocase subunit YajC [Campylobacterota bacterium]
MAQLAQLLPLVIIFGIFYFLIIRPQQKQQKEHEEMLKSLKKGDKILTHGGLHADVVKVEEDFIKIRLNETTIVKLDKSFVTKKL